jgi:AraC family transcriptional regulator
VRNVPRFVGDVVTVGEFRCATDDPLFEDSGPAEHHSFVFPRTALWIQHVGGRPFVADPHIVTFYNPGQQYRRRAIDGRGDRCEWFAVNLRVLSEMTFAFDPVTSDRNFGGFGHAYGLSDVRSYFEQRRIYRHIVTEPQPDSLYVEETVLRILGRVLAKGGRIPRSLKPRTSRDITEAVRGVVAGSFRGRVTLSGLAQTLDTSVFHMCRAFRSVTGTTIHAYVSQLRLRSSLEPLTESDTALIDIALEHGFSSHSHFSATFRSALGMTPSRARAAHSISSSTSRTSIVPP